MAAQVRGARSIIVNLSRLLHIFLREIILCVIAILKYLNLFKFCIRYIILLLTDAIILAQNVLGISLFKNISYFI